MLMLAESFAKHDESCHIRIQIDSRSVHICAVLPDIDSLGQSGSNIKKGLVTFENCDPSTMNVPHECIKRAKMTSNMHLKCLNPFRRPPAYSKHNRSMQRKSEPRDL